MGDLRNEYITKDFIINHNVVKCISKLDLSLNEFLLILYFINISCDLNMDDIKDKIGLEDEEIYEAFNNLIKKKYIGMNVVNNNGKVLEKIKLDSFYDRLLLNKKVDENIDIFKLYEKELGRGLSSFEYEMIERWISDGVSEDIIKGALKEAILSGAGNFKYIEKIVYEWNKNGIKKRSNNTHEKYKDIEDYNWLEDDE